jgi:cell division septum initiation protein DivIVA
MQKNENVTGINITGGEAIGHSDMSMANIQVELLQRLADRVVQDAEELAARIRREAESEAARLIEDANRLAQGIVDKAQKQAEAAAAAEEKASMMLEQAKQKAMAIEAEALNAVAQARIKVEEDIKKNLIEVVGKIHDELRPSLDYLVERAKTLEEEVRADTNIKGNEAESGPESLVPAAAVPETVDEPHPKLKETIGAVDATESGHLAQGQTGDAEAGVQVLPRKDRAMGSAPPQENSELLEGIVEIDIAPPLNIARLLAVTRYLENTLDIKVLQTSGSWTLGSAITISLDKPLPLINLLKDMPNVGDVKIVDRQKQSSCSEQSDAKKISIILGRNNA